MFNSRTLQGQTKAAFTTLINSCQKKQNRRPCGRLWNYFNADLRRAFADLEADEAANGVLISELLGDLGDVFLDVAPGIALHEALIYEAVGLEKLVQHARQDFLHRL